jgi:hypothetical protein
LLAAAAVLLADALYAASAAVARSIHMRAQLQTSAQLPSPASLFLRRERGEGREGGGEGGRTQGRAAGAERGGWSERDVRALGMRGEEGTRLRRRLRQLLAECSEIGQRQVELLACMYCVF